MVYLALGTNLGDRETNLKRAFDLLHAGAIVVTKRSSIYETAPRDVLDQPWFLNMVAECHTRDNPVELLTKLLHIEESMGRDRSGSAVRSGPRMIDLDILLYNDVVLETERLTIPHPRLLDRRFVLEPLLEVAPTLNDPRTGQRLNEALPEVMDQATIKRI